ncbi:3'-5' exonuclease [Oscillospiraceae bacterium PP1C4]
MSVAVTSFLNPQQEQVAENTQDHILLLAGAGTGKTSTLAYRVANLLATGTAKPEEILCLTFTNRACKEMTERITRIVGEAAQEVTVRTIHSFCVYLLRRTPQSLIDIGRDFTVCDQPDCLELIREVVFETVGRQLEDRSALILQNFIGLVKDCWLEHPEGGCGGATAYAFVHRRAELERICSDGRYGLDTKFFIFLSKYGASIIKLYNLKLAGGNMLDFSDLLLRANEILSNPETAVLWRNRYSYIHVDEVQDVSLAEYGLISKLFGHATMLLCGDFNQTIYQWRGSNPDALINRFEQDCRPLTVELDKNYRSSGQLLAVAKNFLHNAFGKVEKGNFSPISPDCTDVVCKEFETPADEVNWIYQTIADLAITDYSRVAIITRTNKACADVCNFLKANRLTAEHPIRFMLADEYKLFKRAEVKDAIACVNLLANPQDSESLKRVLTRLVHNVGTATVTSIISRYKEGLGVALTDFVDARTHSSGDYFKTLLDALAGGQVVVFDVESTGTDVFSDEIVQVAAVKITADGTVTEQFERFLRPTKPVGDSEKVHHFSDAMLAEQGVPPQTALNEFLDFVSGCVIVGHNVGFDMEITAQNLKHCGVERTFDSTYYDTLDISRRFLKTLENHKLITVAAALGAQNDPTHNAIDDILATADVLVELVKRYLIPQNAARQHFYAKFLPRFAPIAQTVNTLRTQMDSYDAPELVELLIETFGLREKYADEPEKLANLLLFDDFTDDFADRNKPIRQQLLEILELTALSSGALDRLSSQSNKVAVITSHQSKGCEFDYVFLPVLQEGVFPTFQAVKSGDVSEEKRVFYVSITRAKKKLYLSWSHYNENHYTCQPSRFLEMLH